MPDNTSGAWDLIVAPWHLDEHIPDFPVPVGTVATIGPLDAALLLTRRNDATTAAAGPS